MEQSVLNESYPAHLSEHWDETTVWKETTTTLEKNKVYSHSNCKTELLAEEKVHWRRKAFVSNTDSILFRHFFIIIVHLSAAEMRTCASSHFIFLASSRGVVPTKSYKIIEIRKHYENERLGDHETRSSHENPDYKNVYLSTLQLLPLLKWIAVEVQN